MVHKHSRQCGAAILTGARGGRDAEKQRAKQRREKKSEFRIGDGGGTQKERIGGQGCPSLNKQGWF